MQGELIEVDAREQAIDQLHQATAFYTAEPVVGQLLDAVHWPVGERRLVDTSCGDGAFLGLALLRLLREEPNAEDARIAARVQGWEIHYFAASEARRRLASILAQHGRSAARAQALAQSMVVHGDFLRDGPTEPTWDCVTGNPPYLRYANVPAVLREEYERTLPEYSHGDLLHSFLARCAVTCRPGGEIALVTSDRWLFTSSAAPLREVLGQRVGIAQMKRLNCSSAFYRPKTRRAGQPPRIHPVAIVMREAGTCPVALTRAPVYPEADDAAFAGCRTLGELAHVRLAPWLGPHGIFVVDEATAARARLPREALVPAIDTHDIKGGVLSQPTRYAIRTTRAHAPHPAVMAHLESQLHRMPTSKQRTARRWLPPESFEKVDLSQPSLLIPRIACSLKPVRVPAGILPLDHGISIVTAGEATLEQLAEQLQRPEAEAWVRERAARLENGYYSLSTTLLRALPVRL